MGGTARAAPAVDWAAARVRALRPTVTFAVSRPAVGVTVVVPASDPAAVVGGIGGVVTITPAGAEEGGGGRAVPVAAQATVASSGVAAPASGAVRVPATPLRVQSLPGAVAVTCGEDSVDLSGRGTIRIALHLGDGTAVPAQRVAFTVRGGAPVTAPEPSAQDLAFVRELNRFRAQAGVPAVRASPALTAAAAAHAAFVADNPKLYAGNVSVHDEPTDWSAMPGWSGLYAGDRDQAFGSATGGGTEVMSEGNRDPVAFLIAETVFHRDLMLSPSLLAAGAADVGGQFVMDMTLAAGAGSGQLAWPPPGSTAVPTSFGGEWPSPLVPFPGAAFPVGTPVTWADYGLPAGSSLGQASLRLDRAGGGTPVAGYLLTPAVWQARGDPATGVSMGDSLAFVPRRALARDTRYVADLSVRVTGPDAQARMVSLTWSFTTGDGYVGPPGGAGPGGTEGAVRTASADAAPGSGAGPAAVSSGAGSAADTAASAPVAPAPSAAPKPGSASSRVPSAPASAASPAGAPLTPPQALVAARLAGLRLPGASDPPAPFTDMYLTPWAEPAVAALAAQGVVQGIGSRMFGPDEPLTRAQLAVALAKLVPLAPAAPVGAGQVPAWAETAVSAVVACGWMRAPGGSFHPSAEVDRATAITVLSRMAGWTSPAALYAAGGGTWPAGVHPGRTWTGETGADLLWAAHMGLLRGIGGRVAGRSPLTRAQFAVLIWRLAGLVAAGS